MSSFRLALNAPTFALNSLLRLGDWGHFGKLSASLGTGEVKGGESGKMERWVLS
jgi:hypothetical protein